MYNNLSKFVLIVLSIFTFANIVCFFYIKNTTRQMRVEINRNDREIVEEKRKLSLAQIDFNKKYNVNSLQELAKNRLNLQLLNVKQIKEMDEVIK